jgi:hypothetical protein
VDTHIDYGTLLLLLYAPWLLDLFVIAFKESN